MAERALQKIEDHYIDTIEVASAKTVTKGYAIMHSGADHMAENATAITDNAIGIALDSGTAGQIVRYVRLGCACVVPVKVGAGGATRGKAACWAAAGADDCTPSGGTNPQIVLGQFMQSGASGDYVGLNVGMAGYGVKA